MSLADRESGRLLAEALRAPSTVDEVRSESGVVARVERAPEPGIEIRLVPSESDSGPNDWLAMVVTPVAERPHLYPASLPFLAGVGATLTRDGEAVSVIWSQTGHPSCPVLPSEPPPVLRDVTERLMGIAKSGVRSEPAAGSVKAIFDSLSDDKRGELDTFFSAMKSDSAAETWLVSVFDTAVAESEKEGWETESSHAKDSPVMTRKAVLSKGRFERTVFMQAMAQGIVMLRQKVSDNDATAPRREGAER